MGFWGVKPIDDDPDERGKVFVWTREKRIALHLFAFLVFSVLIHGAGFYLFKVVYPTPGRVASRPQSVVVMDPADPAVAPALQRLVDRTVFLDPPSEQSDLRVRLDRGLVRFRPSFESESPELAPPPSPFETGAGELPPPPAPASSAMAPVKLDPALAGRPLAPWSVLHDYLAFAEGLPAMRLSIEVAASGSVRVVGVEAPLDEAAKAELAGAVEATLRFVPASGTASGWIELGGG
jgi:hypothetical protein